MSDRWEMFRKKGIYDVNLSYDENKAIGPMSYIRFPDISLSSNKDFLGYRIGSILGIPAGPLLDSNWIRFYARYGYSILTYKTVRSIRVNAHPYPNVLFVSKDSYLQEREVGDIIYTISDVNRSEDIGILGITNSFGVPSLSPEEWVDDIKRAETFLEDWQILVVSVMGTPNGDDKEALLQDYIDVSKLVYESCAKVLEINLSCPNIGKEVGALYQDVKFAFFLADELKKAINLLKKDRSAQAVVAERIREISHNLTNRFETCNEIVHSSGDDRFREGQHVFHKNLKQTGVVHTVSSDGEHVTVMLGGLRTVSRSNELEVIPDVKERRPDRTGDASWKFDEPVMPVELNVIGYRVEEAIPLIDRTIDRALVEGKSILRVVHGFGTGRLRRAIRNHLKEAPFVKSVTSADSKNGGEAITVVELS